MACLVLAPVAQLAQFLVSPLKQGTDAATQVAAVAGHLPAMRLALLLDVPILLILPAVLYAGVVAGAGRSRLAAAGTALTFASSLGAGYLLGADVVAYIAARQPDRSAANALVAGYQGNGVVVGLVVVYLIGHLIGFAMIGIALARSRAVGIAAIVAAVVLAVAATALAVGYRRDALGLGLAGLAVLFVSVPAVGGAVARSDPANAVGWILLACGVGLPLAVAAYLYSHAHRSWPPVPAWYPDAWSLNRSAYRPAAAMSSA